MPYAPQKYRPANKTNTERYDQYRSVQNAKTYDHTWRKLSLYFRANNPLCEECGKHGMVTAATEVHHKIPIALAPHLRLDQTNLSAVCHECHSKITRQEQLAKDTSYV